MKVGISGHQEIRPSSSIDWVKRTLRQELQGMGAETGVSSLATGADQIFASIALDLGMELEAVIPCEGYESTFGDSADKGRYEELKTRAARCDCLDYPKPSQEAFLRAGQRVVEICDAMIFVWNGKPSGGRGGTADIVAYAKDKDKPFIRLNPSDCSLEKCVGK
jgi:hypothetical protein